MNPNEPLDDTLARREFLALDDTLARREASFLASLRKNSNPFQHYFPETEINKIPFKRPSNSSLLKQNPLKKQKLSPLKALDFLDDHLDCCCFNDRALLDLPIGTGSSVEKETQVFSIHCKRDGILEDEESPSSEFFDGSSKVKDSFMASFGISETDISRTSTTSRNLKPPKEPKKRQPKPQKYKPEPSPKHQDHIKRPPNSFIIYRREMNLRIQTEVSQHPQTDTKTTIRSTREISKETGLRWQNEPQEVKDYYAQLALKEKEDHILKYPDYAYTPLKGKKGKPGIFSVSGKRKAPLCQTCRNVECRGGLIRTLCVTLDKEGKKKVKACRICWLETCESEDGCREVCRVCFGRLEVCSVGSGACGATEEVRLEGVERNRLLRAKRKQDQQKERRKQSKIKKYS